MKKLLLFVGLLFLGMSVSACQTTTTSLSQETSTSSTQRLELTLSESSILLALEEEYLIQPLIQGVSSYPGVTLTYTSENSEIASVSSSGLVIAKQAGQTTIIIQSPQTQTIELRVTVHAGYSLRKPFQTLYQLGEELNLTGLALQLRDGDHKVIDSIPITFEQITEYDPFKTGEQTVRFLYQNQTFGFVITILNEKQQAAYLADIVFLQTHHEVGQVVESFATHVSLDALLEKIQNRYDYQEIHLYAMIQTPNSQTQQISSFWYQDYLDLPKDTVIRSNLNLEGMVNNKDDDYDVEIQFQTLGKGEYRFRYYPKQAGTYDVEFILEVDGSIIQRMKKTFDVEDSSSEVKGFIQVDRTNKRHFIFENGTSYLPVGQNVAWYTSKQRLHYDYKYWFQKMADADMNYARVWLSAWGFSPFWDDIDQFDGRQTNLFSLDKTLEYATEHEIYIQLCFLHHGMFSKTVNPMWIGSANTWYLEKYGANPYHSILSQPGLFFTATIAKANYQNQLRYLVARYGFSPSILSFELFNEVDWVESYSAISGTTWHQEMASFLKAIDINQHMVTTSTKGDSFTSSIYRVFELDEIDYVNVHAYGIYHHVLTLPGKQNTGFETFDKPILYSEVGYSGQGGVDQTTKDPQNITLSQALWGGFMGGGAGSGMNWWWESWIDRTDAYSVYQAAARFAKQMDLQGSQYLLLQSMNAAYATLSVSSSQVGYLGYCVDDRVYLYLFDTTYTVHNPHVSMKSNLTLSLPCLPYGQYHIEWVSTTTGLTLFTDQVVYQSGPSLQVNIPAMSSDFALRIVKNNVS